MTSNLLHHKNYTEFGETYQLVLPLSLEGMIPEDDSVRLLSHELEELDYTMLYKAYSSKGRNPAVEPKTMFKIITYAYSQGIYSSRKIRRSCLRDINFMWLLAGQKAPDHSTIARFRTGFLAESCEDLFYQLVRRLSEYGELSKETVFIDGTKLEACANKYTFVWKKSVNRWEEKMFPKLETAVMLLNHEYMKDFVITKGLDGCLFLYPNIFRQSWTFLKHTVQRTRYCSFTDEGTGKVSTRDISSCSAVFWTASSCTTCTIPGLETVTVIQKRMWTLHSCT